MYLRLWDAILIFVQIFEGNMHISQMPQIYNYISKGQGLIVWMIFQRIIKYFKCKLGELNICFKGNIYVYNICVWIVHCIKVPSQEAQIMCALTCKVNTEYIAPKFLHLMPFYIHARPIAKGNA